MPIIRCYVTEADEKELLAEAKRSGRAVDELAEAAIANACSESRARHSVGDLPTRDDYPR